MEDDKLWSLMEKCYREHGASCNGAQLIMRDPKRLSPLYNEIAEIHSTRCPDIRIGQLFINFETWYKSQYGKDFFYTEDKEFVEYFKKFIYNNKNDY